MAYILVCGGVIVLRYPTHDARLPTLFKGRNFAILVTSYVLVSLCLGFAFDLLPSWTFPWLTLIVILIILLLMIFGCILYVHCKVPGILPSYVFVCPCVPYVPCMGILINSCMIASLKWDSFLRVLVWFLVGLTMYIFYGSKNSK